MSKSENLNAIIEKISKSNLTIYDPLDDHQDLFIKDDSLEAIFNAKLCGLCLDYPIRTRSKVIKTKICEVLGYTIPGSFKKTQPRYPGQDFDTYVQKSNNLQIWNEEIEPTRRYILIKLDDHSFVTVVRVVRGETLARLDKTGTLTQKYQASSAQPIKKSVLVSKNDSSNLLNNYANFKNLLPISELYEILSKLVNKEIPDPGNDQERNRGGELHKKICEVIPQCSYSDSGQFPDIQEQLLEVKLQTSPTIDLGLVLPDSTAQLSGYENIGIRHCDVRYAVFYGQIYQKSIQLQALILTSGADFFSFFRKFEGKVLNKKIQIPLPRDFFSKPNAFHT